MPWVAPADPVLLPSPHSDGGTFTRTLLWRTAIATSQSGREYRRRLRRLPTERLSYGIIGENAERFGDALAPLLVMAAQRCYAPRWYDQVMVSAVAGEFVTTWAGVDLSHRAFVAGGLAVFWRADTETTEIVEVASVGVETITLAAPPVLEWPAGATIAPLAVGRLVSPLAIELIGARGGTLTLVVDLESDIAPITSSGPVSTAPIASISIVGPGALTRNQQSVLVAKAYDATGVEVPIPTDAAWSYSETVEGLARHHETGARGVLAIEGLVDGLGILSAGDATWTLTAGGVSEDFTVTVYGNGN